MGGWEIKLIYQRKQKKLKVLFPCCSASCKRVHNINAHPLFHACKTLHAESQNHSYVENFIQIYVLQKHCTNSMSCKTDEQAKTSSFQHITLYWKCTLLHSTAPAMVPLSQTESTLTQTRWGVHTPAPLSSAQCASSFKWSHELLSWPSMSSTTASATATSIYP